MAKISARGCTAVAKWTCGTSTIVLRSDGAILRKCLDGGGYKIMVSGRVSRPDRVEWVGAWLARRYGGDVVQVA